MGAVPDFAARRAELAPEALAFTDQTTGRDWSFGEVHRAAGLLAAHLLALGLTRGDRVAALCHNRAELFIALFAAQRAGLILVPLNWRLTEAELAPLLARVKARALLHDQAHAAAAEALAPDLPRLQMRITGGFAHPEGLSPLAAGLIDEDAPWYLLFTSGTSGAPKPVIQTARMALAHAHNIAQFTGLRASDRGLCYLPLFHTAGINLHTLPLFLWGGQSTILPKFDASEVLRHLARGGVSLFFGVPAVYQALIDHPAIAHVDLTKLRHLMSGGAALSERLIAAYAARGAALSNGFGLTESGPTGFLLAPDDVAQRPASVGKPQPMTLARLAGVPEGAAGEGELELAGPSVTTGYFDDEAATRAAFTADGWLRTGDIARRDAEGYYWVIDRLKDIFISGGENIAPAEVEAALSQHPAILEAAVVAVPDPRWGEVGVAFLRTENAAELAELPAWCRGRLAAYKVPVRFEIVEDFPRTATGKIRKRALRETLLREPAE